MFDLKGNNLQLKVRRKLIWLSSSQVPKNTAKKSPRVEIAEEQQFCFNNGGTMFQQSMTRATEYWVILALGYLS